MSSNEYSRIGSNGLKNKYEIFRIDFLLINICEYFVLTIKLILNRKFFKIEWRLDAAF